MTVLLDPGDDVFTVQDLGDLTDIVTRTWLAAADLDWSVPAGTMDWSCIATADHAVDCVYAPAFFLASRRCDGYPELGTDFTVGTEATPGRLVESLLTATRLLVAVVNDADPADRAAIFRYPELIVGRPRDFVPRGATELILRAHDVCAGLEVPFDPPADLCSRLRDHTRSWPMWTVEWSGVGRTDDPWADLLTGSGRSREDGSRRSAGDR